MKTLIVFALAISSSAFACGEAQLHPAKVLKIEKTAKSCVAFVKHAQVDVSPACPDINDADIFLNGVEVGLNKDGSCSIDVGQNLSGYVFEKDGVIFRE